MSRVVAWIDRHLATLVIGVLSLIVLACSLTFHEYWRDECQAALIAEETPWTDLLGTLRYEGHPPLLHALLKIASVLPRPLGLSLVGALGFTTLLAGTYAWLRAFTPATARRAVLYTVIATASYTYCYELGVIARGYGYGIGLALVGATLAKRRSIDDPRRAFVPAVLCLSGAILASVHTACLALAIAAGFAIDALRQPGPRLARARRLVLVALGLAPAIAILFYVVSAPADRAFPWVLEFHAPSEPIGETWRLAVHTFAPEGWWEMTWSSAGAAVLTALIVAAIAVVVFARRAASERLGWFLDAAVINTLGMVALSVFRYFGEYRHHTVLAIPWILVLAAVVIAKPRARSALVVIPLGLWQLHQGWLLVGSLHRDAIQPFTQSAAIATRLPSGARAVSTHDALASCVSYLRPDLELRGLQADGRVFSFTRWDRDRLTRAPAERVISSACAGETSVFLITHHQDARYVRGVAQGPNLIDKIDRRKGLTLADEYFELHEVPCVVSPPARSPSP